MQRPGTNPDHVEMTDILCDFCHRAWSEDQPFIEGHRGACICGRCLTVAYSEIETNQSGVRPEADPDAGGCRMCLEHRDELHWQSPVDPEAFICRRCTKQSAGVLHKSPDYAWTKPTAG